MFRSKQKFSLHFSTQKPKTRLCVQPASAQWQHLIHQFHLQLRPLEVFEFRARHHLTEFDRTLRRQKGCKRRKGKRSSSDVEGKKGTFSPLFFSPFSYSSLRILISPLSYFCSFMKGNRGTFSSTPKEGRVWNASRTIRDSRSDHFRLEKLQVQGWKFMQVPFVNSYHVERITFTSRIQMSIAA